MISGKTEYSICIEKANKAANAYYNSDSPIMSDAQYDILVESIREFEKQTGIVFANSPTQNVGATVLSSLKKVSITPKPMLSLDKCHSDEEVAAFAGKHTMIAMVKLDGLSVRIKYNNGKLMSANTRGNGVEGTDITEHIKQFQNVPLEIPYQKELIVDGEAIIKIPDFEEINKNNEFKNPRNAAAGALNVLDTQLVKDRKLSFIAWDVIVGSNYKLLSEKLAEIQSYGFEIVYFITDTPADEIKSANNIIMSFKDEYPCDGVVWKFNDTEYGDSLGQTSHHFKNGIAWKPEVEVVESRLRHIQWQPSRNGILCPVAIFDEVELDGSVISRATLHNYSVMRDVLGPCAYVGEPLKIIKANMIIPQIIEAGPHYNYGEVVSQGGVSANDAPEYCPICGRPISLIVSENGIENMFCENPLCEGKLVQRLDHYCGKRGLDIKGISEATLEKLVNWGWIKDLDDIYNLKDHKQEWMRKDGFGAKSVENILAAIEESKNCNLENFISAIGIPLIGLNVAKEICKHIDSYSKFRELIDSKFDFSEWEGFGLEKTTELLEYDYSVADSLANLMNFKQKEDKKTSNSLENLTVCITGSLTHFKNRNELKEKIEANGGRVTGSVSRKTSILINNDVTSTSAKNLSAQKLNIPILTEEDFIAKYLH